MKKFILFFVLAIGLAFISDISAQTAINEDVSFQRYGRVSDTLNLNDSITTTYYVKDFCTQADIQTQIDSISGTPEATVVFQGSYDNSNWIAIDSDVVSSIGTSGTVVQKLAVNAMYPYIRSIIIGTTSAQNIRYKQVFTIKTN